jgi:glycosyltransferase involved in cell wall biosynthesis
MRDWHGLERVVEFMAGAGRPDLHALFVGDGPARDGLERRAAQLGLRDRVTVTGVVQRAEIPAVLAAFDVALQPAVVEYASPLKLFEYLAVGLPVLAPATPNLREVLVADVNAMLFDPADPSDFARGLQRLCEDEATRRRLGNSARDAIRQQGLTWRRNAERVTELMSRATPGG